MAVTESLGRYTLFLLLTAVSILLLPSLTRAEDYASAQFYTHAFNNDTTVYTGVFALNKDFNLRTSGYVKYTVDFINPSFGEGDDDKKGKKKKGKTNAVSSASAANASGSNSDTRNELTVGLTHDFANIFGAELYFDASRENDYTSYTPTITLKKDLFTKNTTITASYSGSFDTVSGEFLPETKSRTTYNYFLGLTQLLSPRMFFQLGYTLTESSGQMSEGIRLVAINGADASTCTDISATCVGERFPASRTRRAYTAGLSRYFTFEGLGGIFERAALKLTFRYYDDDWKIKSFMAGLEYDKHIYDNMLLTLNYRYYTQGKAFFVKDAYTSADAFTSASPQLENLDTNLIGVKGTYFFPWLKSRTNSLEAKYEFYRESRGVFANVLMVGLKVNY
ncbi:MAG: DUF3570 domain-containing protein [Thermodesulfobacteriota bacterium]